MPNDADRPHDPDRRRRTPASSGAGSAPPSAPGSGGSSSRAGALLMLLGYFGVSREALPGKQIPYLVSGGIGGMFLAVLGAYFLGTQELRRDSGRLDRLEGMVEELHGALLRRPDAPDLTRATAAPTSGPSRGPVAPGRGHGGRRPVPPASTADGAGQGRRAR